MGFCPAVTPAAAAGEGHNGRHSPGWAMVASVVFHAAALAGLYCLGRTVPPLAVETVDILVLSAVPPAPSVSAAPAEEPPAREKPSIEERRPAPARPPAVKPVRAKPRDRPVPDQPSAELPAPAPAPTEPAPPVMAPPPVEAAVTSDFANLIFERIARIARRSYPDSAILRHQQGKVTYHLTLDRDGDLLDHRIEPSGIDSLDRAAEQALLAAAPFPKPPDLNARSYRISGAIDYRLEK